MPARRFASRSWLRRNSFRNSRACCAKAPPDCRFLLVCKSGWSAFFSRPQSKRPNNNFFGLHFPITILVRGNLSINPRIPNPLSSFTRLLAPRVAPPAASRLRGNHRVVSAVEGRRPGHIGNQLLSARLLELFFDDPGSSTVLLGGK